MSQRMMLALVVAILIVAAIGVLRPEWIPGGHGADTPQLSYWMLALLLVSGAGFGFWRFRQDGGRALLSLAIWAALFGAIMLAYNWLN